MLYALLLTLFVFLCFLLVLIVLVQQGKSSLGVGNLGGQAQMLFGGSGGQDIFQKTTWIFVALFMFGSLALSLMKTRAGRAPRYTQGSTQPFMPPKTNPHTVPELPVE